MTRKLRCSRRLWPLVLLVSCRHGFGQISPVAGATAGQSSSSDAAPHTVSGVVVNSVTGEPIYRALVQVGGQYAALTDHEGHFSFEGVTTAGIAPWAMKPGYFSVNRFGRIPVADSFGTPSDEPVVVKLIPEALLTGTVTGPDGMPLEGIPVQLKALALTDGLPHWVVRKGTTTNSQGQYRFSELEAGKYAVMTGFHPEGLADLQGAEAYVPARNPQAGSSGGATGNAAAIVLGPGDHREANLSPEMEKLYPVVGMVSGETRGVTFLVDTANGGEISPVSHFNPRTGEFRLMLPGGTYRITATAYLQRGPMEAQREIVVPQSPGSAVAFALEPYATIAVETEAQMVNQPAEGTASQPSASAPEAKLSLASMDDSSPTPLLAAQPLSRRGDGQAGAQGAMVIENLSPGRYTLRATPPPPWYVSSASCGGVDLTREELVITGSSAGCSLRVGLRNDAGSVHVSVRDSSPTQPSGVLYLLPLGDVVRTMTAIPINQSDVSREGVAPGRYLVLALDHRAELPYRDPEAMRHYAEIGEEITVPVNGKVDVEVSLVRGEP